MYICRISGIINFKKKKKSKALYCSVWFWQTHLQKNLSKLLSNSYRQKNKFWFTWKILSHISETKLWSVKHLGWWWTIMFMLTFSYLWMLSTVISKTLLIHISWCGPLFVTFWTGNGFTCCYIAESGYWRLLLWIERSGPSQDGGPGLCERRPRCSLWGINFI